MCRGSLPLRAGMHRHRSVTGQAEQPSGTCIASAHHCRRLRVALKVRRVGGRRRHLGSAVPAGGDRRRARARSGIGIPPLTARRRARQDGSAQSPAASRPPGRPGAQPPRSRRSRMDRRRSSTRRSPAGHSAVRHTHRGLQRQGLSERQGAVLLAISCRDVDARPTPSLRWYSLQPPRKLSPIARRGSDLPKLDRGRRVRRMRHGSIAVAPWQR